MRRGAAIVPIGAHNLVPEMTKELPVYLVAAATCTGFDRSEVATFTEGLLKWWRVNNPTFPAWAKAARICFAMLPSSAPSERVFSLHSNTTHSVTQCGTPSVLCYVVCVTARV